MRSSKKRILSFCVALVVALWMPSINVYAASDTYTVTFRPGNVGYFATEANPNGDRKAMAEAVAAQEYSGYAYEVTNKGAIKLTVLANQTAPDAPGYIQTENGYFVKNVSEWGPAGETIDRNTDYVVDYGKLVNGVEYTVKYVDSESGESVAPVYIAQANVGDEVTRNAPAQIVISEATVYKLSSTPSITLALDEDASKNVFTFSYTMEESETIVEEVIIETDGGITVSTEYISEIIDRGTTIIPGGGATGGGAAAGGGAGGAAGAEAEAAADNVVDIADEETPLAAGFENTENAENAENEEGAVVEIGEEEVPLASGEEPFANMAMVGATIFAVAAVLIAGMWLFIKKRNVAVKVEDTTEK